MSFKIPYTQDMMALLKQPSLLVYVLDDIPECNAVCLNLTSHACKMEPVLYVE